MMKRELAALAVLMLLIAASIWNIHRVDNITEEISIALCKSKAASEQLNFKNSRRFLEEGLEIWQENLAYTQVVLSQINIDETTQAFYRLSETLSQEDVLSILPAYDALQYQLETIRSSEKISVGSIF